MRLSEKILLLLSRKPENEDYQSSTVDYNLDNALDLLCKSFPDFLNDIRNKKILDFGCGLGTQTIALLDKGARFVVGVDTNTEVLEKARNCAKERGLQDRVKFINTIGRNELNKFDIVISQNSMEHFKYPIGILNEMKATLSKEGKIYITFGPPWFAPYGSHMHFFTRVPWVNILFSEKTVMNVRKKFRQDGATKYEEVKSGLNKMSVNKFEKMVSKGGLNICCKKYQCIKNINFLSKVPLVRELVINRVNSILCTSNEI